MGHTWRRILRYLRLSRCMIWDVWNYWRRVVMTVCDIADGGAELSRKLAWSNG